jgi:soluble lytic murein transglycosylase-like protein
MTTSAIVGLALATLVAQAPGQPRTPPPAPSPSPAQPLAQPSAQPSAPRTAKRMVVGAVQSLERAAKAREQRKATEKYDPIFRKYTKRYFGVATDWRWFKAQGMAESDLVPTARSRVGARGIMQLMPSTFAAIQSQRREFTRIDDPEWNIAAGIAHDRYLWTLWKDRVHDEDERWDFMFGSYNAGQGTIYRAQRAADSLALNRACWKDIEQVAPTTPRWRYTETLGYVRKIRANKAALPER